MKAFSPDFGRWWPVALWAGLVVYASTGAASAQATGSFARPLFLWFCPWLTDAALNVLNLAVRKTAHVLQFFVFALLVWRAVRLPPAWPTRRGMLCAAILAAALALGSLSEGIQLFFAGRSASLADAGLNLLGAVFGMMIIWVTEGRHTR